jgi:hypothetical protein
MQPPSSPFVPFARPPQPRAKATLIVEIRLAERFIRSAARDESKPPE